MLLEVIRLIAAYRGTEIPNARVVPVCVTPVHCRATWIWNVAKSSSSHAVREQMRYDEEAAITRPVRI